ncbi:hypothetical protein PGC35_15665 [Psychrobacillus sp. PGGUH221]|uniref:hypothetical protein n=1 Tax=Psychrobacillus sp. PGGUH221 TaxID=3020058 RepID=UPI0035C67F81
MNNIQRLQMETKGIELDQQELIIYLQENGLKPHDEYNATSQDNKKAIYQTALSVLESVANNPSLMKTIRLDDMTVSQFHENLTQRIDQLYKTIRQMKTDQSSNSDIFMLYL